MLKRLPFLCAAMFALAACSHGSDSGAPAGTPAPAQTAPTAPAAPATAPAAPAASGSAAAATAATVAEAAPASAGTAQPQPAPPAEPFVDTGKWVEGKHYFRIQPAQPKLTGTDKIEVVEVFSFGCPACNAFHGTADKIARELPANATMAYLPASFIPQENWPMLQRAYLTAKALGVDSRESMDAMYDAVWKSGELSAMNASGSGLKPRDALPTLADAAKVYAKFGIAPKDFVATANSFSINTQARRSDEMVRAYGVDGTPTLVIDGKYRFSPSSAGSYDNVAELTRWLVAREAAGK